MNAYSMPGNSDLGMVWLGNASSSQDLSMGLSSSESGDMILDHDSPYYLSSHNGLSHQSIDDDISNMTMEGMDLLPYSDVKHESSDGSCMEDENSPVYMITTATQTTSACPTRKIKPIKHPGLVLKTPIAYQSNTDPSVIPIQKDGIAICEKCGAIGVKHAFYTKERRFCSMTCARSYNGLLAESLSQNQELLQDVLPQTFDLTSDIKQYMSHRFKMEIEDDFTGLLMDQPFPQIVQAPPPVSFPEPPQNEITNGRRRIEVPNSYDWDPELIDPNFSAAPVTCFKHAPLSDIWDNILVGMKVEVENTDSDNESEAFSDSFWVATVIRIVGYKALLRYEGFELDDSKDFLVSICSNRVHPVGWCATRGKPLIPPKSIQDRYSDWKQFLCKRLTGARTLPSNFTNKVAESMKSRFHCGLNIEVIDKERISQVKLANIYKIVGKRLNIRYYDLNSVSETLGFWCHEDSPLIHPVGWAKRVGHHIDAPLDYIERINNGVWLENDAKMELFKFYQIGSPDDRDTNGFSIGMKLEAIDPLNMSTICAATIMDVLHCGYIMVRIDTYESDASGADWFCYHVTSPCILPVGFCSENGIILIPPSGYTQEIFNWDRFLNETGNAPVTKHLLNHPVPLHGFTVGMKLEAADLMDPRLICVATIDSIVSHLIRIRFDGWDNEFDQWLDSENCSIYPVGWAQSIDYKLEGPCPHTVEVVKPPKPQPKKRGRKKKKDSPSKPAKNSEVEMDVPIKTEILVEKDVEPEVQLEPTGPEQNMPISTDPPPERKVTSYINSHENATSKVIPRLIDNTGGSCEGIICPEEWNVFDVAQFLRVNDCGNYCDTFSKNKIDGKTFLNLKNSDIVVFTNGKVGPSLKIFNLIQQLKDKTKPAQLRLHPKSKLKSF